MTDVATSFWVIERYNGDTLLYWSARGGHAGIEYFEPKIEWAVKFADKKSGSAILHHHLKSIGRVVEHSFVSS